MAWKGDSRRHSLARKGIKTAKPKLTCKGKRKYTEEELIAMDIDELDLKAFNIKQGIHEFSPEQLNIKWHGDLENAIFVMQEAKTVDPKDVDLSEPIDVILENGELWVDDGHHRWLSAKLTGRKLKGDLTIKDNPIQKILADQENN